MDKDVEAGVEIDDYNVVDRFYEPLSSPPLLTDLENFHDPLNTPILGPSSQIIEELRQADPKWWSTVIQAAIKEYGLSGQHIESYNDFISNLQGTIDAIKGFTIVTEPKRSEGQRGYSKTTNQFKFIGDSLKISNPQQIEADGQLSKMLPNISRLRGCTYAVEMRIDIEWSRQNPEIYGPPAVSRHPFKFQMPVMVNSILCRRTNMSNDEFTKYGECPMDPGGYFIINGKEKVVISQERCEENFVHVFEREKQKKYYEAEIRSSPPNTPTGNSIFRIHFDEKLDKQSYMPQRILQVNLPGVRTEIPISLFYQAYGIQTPLEALLSIVEICGNSDDRFREQVEQLLFHTLQSWNPQLTQTNAKFFIGHYIQKKTKKITSLKLTNEGAERIRQENINMDNSTANLEEIADKLLQNTILPHIGTKSEVNLKKAYYISYMIWKLLLVEAKIADPDDRDHLMNKIVFNAGPLIAQIFHASLHRFRFKILKELQSNAQRKAELELEKCLNASCITRDLEQALATGNWGDKRKIGAEIDRIYSNVTGELNRYNRLTHLSLLRRVKLAEDKLVRSLPPRYLHNTHFGYYCCNETPEGISVGLVRHLALLTRISLRGDEQAIMKFVKNLDGFIPLPDVLPDRGFKGYINGIAKVQVHVGGVWIGFTSQPETLLNMVKEKRRSSVKWNTVSVAWDRQARVIYIITEPGRLCRPLFVAKQNILSFEKTNLDKLKDETLKNGFSNLIKEGIVEMIDPREEDFETLIAMEPKNLHDCHNSSRTHMEIHPLTILGITGLGGLFQNHNPSPRNIIQAQMAKQGMGLPFTNFNDRMDTSAHVLHYPQKPLVNSTGMELIGFNESPNGANCIVAISTFLGYNQEDAYIVNKGSLERGLFRGTIYHTINGLVSKTTSQKLGEDCFTLPTINFKETLLRNRSPSQQAYKNLDLDGFPSPGVIYEIDDQTKAIIGKVTGINKEVAKNFSENQHLKFWDDTIFLPKFGTPSINHGFNQLKMNQTKAESQNRIRNRNLCVFKEKEFSAWGGNHVVDEVLRSTTKAATQVGSTKLRKAYLPQVGDKLNTLHAQKGVIGLIMNQEDLPFSKDGMVPDIIINPHGLPGRMAIGQLLEILFGKAVALKPQLVFQDGTPMQPIDIDAIGRTLEGCGFNSQGNEPMHNPFTGRTLNTPIFIGPAFVQPLKHIMDNKVRSYNGGKNRDPLTRQPTDSLRLGEMERDCLIVHGGGVFLQEKLLTSSDSYMAIVCNQCGLITSSIPKHVDVTRKKKIISEKVHLCKLCSGPNGKGTDLTTINIPYAAKLLFDELMSMNVSPRLICDSKSSKN